VDSSTRTAVIPGDGIGKDLGRAAYEANLRTKTVLIDFADDAA
jgi:hypothetical protein